MSDPQQHAHNWSFILRIVIKAALLFAAINILFAVFDLTATSGKISLYNGLLTGRERLPYGEDRRAYNLSLNDLDAMFASHRISQPKAADEFRVVIIGDSSVWGILLNNDETLSGQLNQMQLQRDGRTIRAYNIGHPIMSATKDLMLLEIALQHEPDLIVWPLTLASLIRDEQLNPPLLQANAQRIRALIARYDLALDANALPAPSDFWQRSLIARRRAIADWLRLQLYSVAWTVTGVDQLYGEYTPRSNDFSDDIRWQDYAEPVDYPADVLAFDVVQAAIRLADDVPETPLSDSISTAGTDRQ